MNSIDCKTRLYKEQGTGVFLAHTLGAPHPTHNNSCTHQRPRHRFTPPWPSGSPTYWCTTGRMLDMKISIYLYLHGHMLT